MESKYTKYSIIELVPVEIKSYDTPLYTIVNSIILWIWLIAFYVYMNVKAISKSIKSFIFLHKRKYTTYKPLNEESKNINDEESEFFKLDKVVIKKDFIKSEVETYNGKTAVKMFKILIDSDEVIKNNINEKLIKNIGSFVLRKETIFFNENDENVALKDQVILVRAVSYPVKLFLNFFLKKIF